MPVSGRGPTRSRSGPIHAGVIESGHFRFHVVGERILHLDPRLFYKHRGLERAAEGREPAAGLAFAQRACGACAVTNSVAYAQACEGALGLVPARELRRGRTLLLELERLYNHLNDVAAICAGVGFAPGNMAFAALKERALRLNGDLAGHRFLFGSVAVGASAAGGSSARGRRAPAARCASSARTRRAPGASSPSPPRSRPGSTASACSTPPTPRRSARSARRRGRPGSAFDAAAAAPASGTAPIFAAAVPPASRRATSPPGCEIRGARADGDAGAARRAARRADRGRGRGARRARPTRSGSARVESPRGETVCAVELDARAGSRRLHLRTGSYANWPALAHATAGNLLPDFPLINKSFELCYACADR